jgi:hypothetical protein
MTDGNNKALRPGQEIAAAYGASVSAKSRLANNFGARKEG